MWTIEPGVLNFCLTSEKEQGNLPWPLEVSRDSRGCIRIGFFGDERCFGLARGPVQALSLGRLIDWRE